MSTSKQLLLCGDIGGTKALFGLNEVSAGDRQSRRVFTKRYQCGDYPTFSALLSTFLADGGVRGDSICGGCLAVAAPVPAMASVAKFTNLPWQIDTAALCQEFGIPHLVLHNDLYAAAAGIEAVADSNLMVLQRGASDAAGVRLLIGAGTGLGMALLIPQSGSWRIVPGEVGHAGFAPSNRQLGEVWSQLSLAEGRVCNERIISGRGIATLYRFLAGDNADCSVLAGHDPAAMISQRAIDDSASICRQAMDLFFSAYGAFAGDMALSVLAKGGVFLTGGVTVRNTTLLQSSPFLDAFNAKAEHVTVTRQIPVVVVNDMELSLNGAALLAQTSLVESAC